MLKQVQAKSKFLKNGWLKDQEIPLIMDKLGTKGALPFFTIVIIHLFNFEMFSFPPNFILFNMSIFLNEYFLLSSESENLKSKQYSKFPFLKQLQIHNIGFKF